MVKYLPLGSIVLLKGGLQKILIISRALNVKNGGKEYFFDYGGVAYPEGLVGDEMAYFNADKINKVIFEGYSDVEDENIIDTINTYLKENPNIVKGDPGSWNLE